jgi:hypothetical protein
VEEDCGCVHQIVYGDESLPPGDEKLTLEDFGIKDGDTLSVRDHGFSNIVTNPTVDVCFLVDCTGSMRSSIEAVKNNVKKVTVELENKFGECDIRFGFVRYTDYDVDESKRTSSLDFTENLSDFETFVGDITANGGGDAAEDVLGGFKVVFDLSWRPQCTKVLIHIADFPCHGTMYHDSNVGDSYPQGDKYGLKHDDMMRKVMEMSIDYWFGYIDHEHTDKMVTVFNESLMALTKKRMVIRQFDAMKEDKMLSGLVRSITTSIKDLESNTTSIKDLESNKKVFDLETKRGLAILVTCDYEGSGRALPGTNDDLEEMYKTFNNHYQYDVHRVHNRRKDDIIRFLQKISYYLSKEYNGSDENKDGTKKTIVFAFAGHGGCDKEHSDYIEAQDSGKIEVTADVVNAFLGYTGKVMRIPKLFFFDACRGTEWLIAAPDRGAEEEEVNFRIDYAAIPDHKTPPRDRWMTCVAETFRKTDLSLEDVIAVVKKKIYDDSGTYIQQPETRDQLVSGRLKL